MSQIKGTPPPASEETRGQVIFFCEAEKASLDGLYKEERFADGSMKTPSRSIQFNGCCFTTTDPDEIEFLRGKCKTMNSPNLVECKDQEEFETYLQARKLKRAGMYQKTDDVAVEINATFDNSNKTIGKETVNAK
jgi:hypothetical protein